MVRQQLQKQNAKLQKQNAKQQCKTRARG